MNIKLFTSISFFFLLATLVAVSMLSRSATAVTKGAVSSEACECSKLAWMKLFKDPVNFVWSCQCGKTQCLVTCKFGSPAISCVERGMF